MYYIYLARLIVMASRSQASVQSECQSWTMAMATSSQSNSDGNAKKVPMSPSEFFAKIYGTDRKSADSSSSTEEDKPTASGMQIVTHRSLTETAHPSSLAAIALQQHRSVSATSSWHLYPSWNPEQLFWASRNQGSFFDPLSLPPALTALSKQLYELFQSFLGGGGAPFERVKMLCSVRHFVFGSRAWKWTNGCHLRQVEYSSVESSVRDATSAQPSKPN